MFSIQKTLRQEKSLEDMRTVIYLSAVVHGIVLVRPKWSIVMIYLNLFLFDLYLGVKYAWITMKIVLASLLLQYKVSTEIKYENITTKWDANLKIVGGHMIKLEKRGFISTKY